MDHSGPCIYAGGKISGNFTQDHRELSHKKLQISVAASAKFPNHRSAGPKVLTGDPHAQRRQIATDGMEFGRRARAGRRGDPEPSGPARSSGDGQLDYLDPDLFGGDSPGTPEDRSPRAKSRGGTPRKAQVGSIADDFDEDTDDEGAAPPSRGLDAAGGWGDEGGGGGGHGGQMGRRPDPRAPRGGFFDEDENDDAPPRLEGRRQATGAMSPPPQQRPGGIAADFDDESPARPALSGVSRRKAREMEEDDSYMMVDQFADLAVRGGARGSPDPSLRSGRRIDPNGEPNRGPHDWDGGVETAVDDIASIPDAEFEQNQNQPGPQSEVADVPRGYVNRRSRFVMPDDLAKEAPERFEPAREEYRREGRDDLDNEIDLSPLLAQLLSREEAFAEDPDEVWTADSLWAEIRGVLQAEADEKARAEEELEKLEREREKI